jgi:hypothetical protein
MSNASPLATLQIGNLAEALCESCASCESCELFQNISVLPDLLAAKVFAQVAKVQPAFKNFRSFRGNFRNCAIPQRSDLTMEFRTFATFATFAEGPPCLVV